MSPCARNGGASLLILPVVFGPACGADSGIHTSERERIAWEKGHMHRLLSQMVSDVARTEQTQEASSRRRGVMLINLGTPDEPSVPAVRRYLNEFLRDPAVIHLPKGLGWLTGPLGRTIATLRAPASAEMYRRIWTEEGSPLKTIADAQATAVEAALPRGWRVFSAMRYGRPGIVETLREVEAADIRHLVVLPMYPQFSGPTTGTALQVVYDYLKRESPQFDVTVRTTWYDDHGYVNAQTELLEEYAGAHGLSPDDTYLLFSTHGLPTSYVKRGDPYPRHVARTAALVAHRMGWAPDRMSLAYQSRFGPVAWLKPYTDEVLRALVRGGEKRILICPISFTTDCLETLEEIDLRYRAMVEDAGGELFLSPALNASSRFISALKQLVLRGPRPMGCAVPKVRSTQTTRPDVASPRGSLRGFLMVGASLDARLGSGRGPRLAGSTVEGLRGVKRSQCAVPGLLRTIQDDAGLKEAWLWNTCHRFELYGWLDDRDDLEARAEAVAAVRGWLFGQSEPEGLVVNTLLGAQAWHHLLRTSVGLNSGLPGERDVLDQLDAAHRLACRAGTAGTLTDQVADDARSFQRTLRNESSWSAYAPDYCFAALSRVIEDEGLDLARSRIVVVGGSTTSASVLRVLRDEFDVPDKQLSLYYRGHKHGGQVKLLRKAIGHGRRIRVQSYGEPRVLRGIQSADVVVFGVDRDDPILCAQQLQGARDWVDRPLTIFDFNLFGSTDGVAVLPGVTLFAADQLEDHVSAFADDLCRADGFASAVATVETAIENHVRGSDEPVPASMATDNVCTYAMGPDGRTARRHAPPSPEGLATDAVGSGTP